MGVGVVSEFPESFEVVGMQHEVHASRYSDPDDKYKLAQGSKVAYGRSQAVKKGAEKLAQGLARMLAGKADAQLEEFFGRNGCKKGPGTRTFSLNAGGQWEFLGGY